MEDYVTDMKVCQIPYDECFDLGSPNDDDPHHPDSDWSKIQKVCCFSHREYCEFIVYLGCEEFSLKERLEKFVEVGMSGEFLKECTNAIEAGYKYACFYA